VSSSEGNKKVFSITEAGRAHLEENREMIDHVLDHLERFGRKMAKARDWFGWSDDSEDGGRRGRHEKRDRFRALRHRLRAALSDIVDAPEDKQAEAISILEDAAAALEALSHR
ncbi:MAG: PadR family transcriptional regulator, partial [Mesorhizobium sp.]